MIEIITIPSTDVEPDARWIQGVFNASDAATECYAQWSSGYVSPFLSSGPPTNISVTPVENCIGIGGENGSARESVWNSTTASHGVYGHVSCEYESIGDAFTAVVANHGKEPTSTGMMEWNVGKPRNDAFLAVRAEWTNGDVAAGAEMNLAASGTTWHSGTIGESNAVTWNNIYL